MHYGLRQPFTIQTECHIQLYNWICKWIPFTPKIGLKILITAIRNSFFRLREFRNLSLFIKTAIWLTIKLSECFLFRRLSWWFDPPHQDQWQRHGIWRRNEISQYYESRKYLVMTKTRLDRRSRSFWHCYLNWKANQSLLLAYTSVAFQPYIDRQTDK